MRHSTSLLHLFIVEEHEYTDTSRQSCALIGVLKNERLLGFSFFPLLSYRCVFAIENQYHQSLSVSQKFRAPGALQLFLFLLRDRKSVV